MWIQNRTFSIFLYNNREFKLTNENSKDFKKVWFEGQSSFSRAGFKKAFPNIKKVNSPHNADLLVFKAVSFYVSTSDKTHIPEFWTNYEKEDIYLEIFKDGLKGRTIVFDDNIVIENEGQVFENEEDLMNTLVTYFKSRDREMRNLGVNLILSNLNPKENGQFLLTLFSKHISFDTFSYPIRREKKIWISQFKKEFPHFKT